MADAALMATTTLPDATTATTAAVRSKVPTAGDIATATAEFLALRRRLLGIAHRILGSRAEAEDIVQDAWLRWQGCDRAAVDSPTAFLVTATTRLAINAANSARVRRAADVGESWPESVDTTYDPSVGAERREALERAILLLLERLGPMERAAYVLRHGFDYPHRQIAEVLGTTEANARQILVRAGRHLRAERRRAVDPAEHRRVTHAFALAARRGEVRSLEDVLAGAAGRLTAGGPFATAA